MDVGYEVVRKATSAQSDKIQSAVFCGLFASNNIWRNVLAKAATALNHNVSTDSAELMAQYC